MGSFLGLIHCVEAETAPCEALEAPGEGWEAPGGAPDEAREAWKEAALCLERSFAAGPL